MSTDALESEDPIPVSSRENCVNIQEQHGMETNPIECDDVENKRKRRCTSVMWEHFVKKKKLMELIMLFATTVRINSKQIVGMAPKVYMTILTDVAVYKKKT